MTADTLRRPNQMLYCMINFFSSFQILKIRITSQDLEDERQDCLYLRKQIVKLLKELESSRGHLKKASKVGMNENRYCHNFICDLF